MTSLSLRCPSSCHRVQSTPDTGSESILWLDVACAPPGANHLLSRTESVPREHLACVEKLSSLPPKESAAYKLSPRSTRPDPEIASATGCCLSSWHPSCERIFYTLRNYARRAG